MKNNVFEASIHHLSFFDESIISLVQFVGSSFFSFYSPLKMIKRLHCFVDNDILTNLCIPSSHVTLKSTYICTELLKVAFIIA